MSYNWKEVQFKELYAIPSRNGLNRPSAVRGSGYKMINMGEIFANDRLHDIDMELVLLNNNEKKQFQIIENDLIFARQSLVAEGAGKCSIVLNVSKMTCFESHIIRVRLNKNLTVPLFYYYYFQSSLGKGLLSTIRQQGVQAGIRGSDLSMIKIHLPSLSTQKKIAKILTNYDDLIENNLKCIKLLEETARRTYEEWFLRFKINDKKLDIDQSTGLPFGWKKIKVRDYVATISRGPSLNYNLGESEGVEVLNQSCIRNGEIELEKILIAKDINNNKKSSYLKINDILINSMGVGTLGRVSKNVSINSKMIIHNCITFLRAKEIYSQYMLFYFISSHEKYFESVANGSTGQSSLKKELIEDITITLPDNKSINNFDLIASSIWTEIGIKKNQNKLLKEARDILLPRLMTGMIDTEKMDVTI